MFFLCGAANAAQVTLAWNPVSGDTVAGYKLYYGTRSAGYTGSVDAGKTAQYTFTNLADNTTYYFAAKTYDGNRNESVYSNEVSRKTAKPYVEDQSPPVDDTGADPTPGDQTGGTIAGTYKFWIEAEDGDIFAPMAIEGDSTASLGGFIWSPHESGTYYEPNPAAGSSAYRIQIPAAGRYLIWARTFSSAHNEDSFYVSMNGGAYTRWDVPVRQAWVWSRIPLSTDSEAPLNLSQGIHTLSLLQREDGTKFDRILVTDNMDYVPEGQGEIVSTDSPIWLEAEDGTIGAPMQIFNEGNASGGRYAGVSEQRRIHTSPDPGAGYVEFSFEVPQAGDYRLWGRVLAPSWSADSFFVAVDNQPFTRWNLKVGNNWHWEMVREEDLTEPLLFSLAAGRHTLTLLCREDGTMIDQILITSDMQTVPE